MNIPVGVDSFKYADVPMAGAGVVIRGFSCGSVLVGYLPPPRRLCFHFCLFVCLFVSLFVFSRITQYLLDRFSHKSAESDTWAGRTPQILIVIRITLWLGLRLTFCVIAVGTLLRLGESFSATLGLFYRVFV